MGERAAPMSAPEPASAGPVPTEKTKPLVHLAGKPVGSRQSCRRCGELLAVSRTAATPYPRWFRFRCAVVRDGYFMVASEAQPNCESK